MLEWIIGVISGLLMYQTIVQIYKGLKGTFRKKSKNGKS